MKFYLFQVRWVWLEQGLAYYGTGLSWYRICCLTQCLYYTHTSRTKPWHRQVPIFRTVSKMFESTQTWIYQWYETQIWWINSMKYTVTSQSISKLNELQWTLVIVNAWIVNNLSLVNIFGGTVRLFYNMNYMLNSKHLSLVNKIGDKTEFTITRVHCSSISCFSY